MNCIYRVALLLGIQSLLAVASAQEPEQVKSTEIASVYVVSARDPDWKTYRAFMAGIDAFNMEHVRAPDAALRFVLTPRKSGLSYQGLALRIASDEASIVVPVEQDGSFSLPRNQAAADAGAELLLNQKRDLFRWRPSIHSPGIPVNSRRLGDLRLECTVRWAVEQADFPGFVRAVAQTFGGACQSSSFNVDFLSAQAIRSVYLIDGERRETLSHQFIELSGHAYLPPLHDSSWPDSTLLVFDYVSDNH